MSLRCYSTKLPRFTETLKEASKPALQNSLLISKPFGLNSPTLLNPNNENAISYQSLKYNLFSSEAKEKRQKVLDHDIAHSPFYESKSFENVNGKIFTPPISYFKKDKSKFFPDFISNTLTSNDVRFGSMLGGKISIVRIYSTISGDQVSKTYFQDDSINYLDNNDEFSSKFPLSQIIDINMPQSAIKRFLVNLSKNNLKKIVPIERQSKYFILPYDVFPLEVRKELNCDNTCSGYIYLLDNTGRIRWATSGSANESEYSLMWKCVAGLEKELKKQL